MYIEIWEWPGAEAKLLLELLDYYFIEALKEHSTLVWKV